MRTGDGPLRQRILSRGCILPSKLWLTCVSFDDVIQYRQTITSRVGSSTHGSKEGMRHCYKSMGRMWLGGKRFKHRQAQHPTPKARSSKCGKVTKRWHQQWYGHLFLETRERTLRSSGASPPTAPPLIRRGDRTLQQCSLEMASYADVQNSDDAVDIKGSWVSIPRELKLVLEQRRRLDQVLH